MDENESVAVGWVVDGCIHADVTKDVVEIRRYSDDHVTVDQYVREDVSRIRELEARLESANSLLDRRLGDGQEG